jgi:TRAP-type uncharacterized transport system substrate-binding protein
MLKRTLLIGAGMAALSATFAQAKTEIRLCTGGESGVYYAAGREIAGISSKLIDVKVVETEGTLDNLERTLDLAKGEPDACDAMIGQPDGPVYLSRQSPASVRTLRQVGTLHREYLHVLCNKESGVDNLSDLESDPSSYSLAVGESGSGAWLLWQNFISEDEDYGEIPTTSEGGVLALSAVASGITTCMLVPAGLGNGTTKEADGVYGSDVILAEATDYDFNDAQDIRGKALYEFTDIPGDTYEVALQSGWGGSKETVSWLAGVYINMDKIEDKKALTAFIKSVSRASVTVKSVYGK